MFILISGYLSKRKWSQKKLLKNYILPYIIFDLLWVFYSLIRETISIRALNLFIPTYVYWYILCLCIMRIISFIPVFNKIFLPISFILTMMSPYLDKDLWLVLSLGRVALLYPIFYFGKVCSREFINKIRYKKRNMFLLMCACVAGELLLLAMRVTDITWASHDYPQNIKECILKYFFMLFVLGTFAGFAAIIPNRKTFLTKWGRNSLMVYLLHPFVVDILKAVLGKLYVQWNISFYFVAVIMAVLITNFLSKESLKIIYNVIIERIYSFFARLNKS